jgi:membrane dipeptidase
MSDGLERIRALLRGAPLIDGHNDLLWETREQREKTGEQVDIARPCPALDTDLPRLAAGCVGGQFWSVYVPSGLPPNEAVTQTLVQLDALFELVRAHPDRLELARTADDVERIAASGKVASLIGVEGGHCIGGSLAVLRVLARLGMRYLTLTHDDDTPWADSCTGDHAHGGLTDVGREVVRELNRLGVLVDLSHVSDETMRDAIEASAAPVIFSHSSARTLTDVERNVPDDVLELVARTGGVVMATFVPFFVTARRRVPGEESFFDVFRRIRAEYPHDREARHAASREWVKAHPAPPATLANVADHIDHIRDVAGIDHVGIGSDFDGVDKMPEGLEDVSRYPALFAELAHRGYSDDDLRKIAGRNVLRVMREAERVAARS